MRILGISAFYHDSAAALIEDGRIIAAAQEERFTRIKHDASFPARAIAYCLEEAGCALRDIDHVAFYEKPFLKFERLLETYLALAPAGFRSFATSMPLWIKEKLFQKRMLIELLSNASGEPFPEAKLLFSEHHLSHAASAFYASPFHSAAVLTADGVGEWTTTSLGLGAGSDLHIHKEIPFPHSLGLLYSAFTYYLGFKVNSGEYKVMGLAPYGRPRYRDRILEHLIDLKEDGSFRLRMRYFNYCGGFTMTNRHFDALFGAPPRSPDAPLDERAVDLAASIQAVCEEVMLRLARHAARETGERNLCLAGGVALNCVANGKLLRSGLFDDIWIQPAAGDAGGALGAALAAHYGFLGKDRPSPEGDGMKGAYLGPAFAQDAIEARLSAKGARFSVPPQDQLIGRAADLLAEGGAIGWFQGRMEFGPRALGARSILGDPRQPDMQSRLNLKIKFREDFRPFAPAILAEDTSAYFDLDRPSPYMMLVCDVAEERRKAAEGADDRPVMERVRDVRSDLPAITHLDYSARVQTVDGQHNPRFHALLSAFKARTGCPVLVNTSFNVRGEPIVCTPEEAFDGFMATDLDALVIGDCLLLKPEQDPALLIRDRAFAPD